MVGDRSRPSRGVKYLLIGGLAGAVVIPSVWLATRSSGAHQEKTVSAFPTGQGTFAPGVPGKTPKPGSTPGSKITASPSPSPGNPGPSRCKGFPAPACTGVPAGTKLTPLRLNLDGDTYRVTTSGMVLDRVHIPGNLLITANNVTIRNSQIDGGVLDEYSGRHYSFSITDSTVGPAGGCRTEPGIGEANYTATRVVIRGHGDGFRDSGNNINIQDSYVHLCSNPGDHSDGIQTYMAGRGLIFNHNTVDQRDAKDITAPIFLVDTHTVDVRVTNNLVMGGTYSIQLKNAHGSLVVQGNKMVDKTWIYGPVESQCGNINWSGNTLVTIDRNYRVTSTVGPLPCHS